MLQILVVTVVFMLMMRIAPIGAVQDHTVSAPKAYQDIRKERPKGDPFTSEDKKLQMIYFSNEHIYQMRIYMDCAVEKDAEGALRILFRLYDDGFSCIYEEKIDSRKIQKEGCATATPDMDVEQGRAYYHEVLIPEDSSAAYRLPVADRTALAQPENSTLFIDGIINDEVSLITAFDYTRPLSFVEIILYDMLILFLGAISYTVLVFLVQFYDVRWSGYSQILGRWIRAGAACLVLAGAAVLIICSVILNRFGGEVWDRLVFLAGILVAAAWALGFLYLRRRVIRPREQSRLTAGDIIWSVWRDYIQTVSFGLLFYALCQYVNADRLFLQYTNTRWMLIFLAIAFLMNYNKKLIMNKASLLWLLAAAAGSLLYCRAVGTDEDALHLAELSCGVVAAWGLVILTIIIDSICYGKWYKGLSLARIRRLGRENRQQAVFIGLWAVFCILMIAYRYEKVWVFTATLPFLALFFTKGTPAFRGRFLKNLSNGILLSFGLVTLFCLLHRPHHYWMLYRYGGIFHTVACTGMYLAVVFGTAAARLFGKLKDKKGMLTRCPFEYLMTACAAGSILLTMSRTAFLTTTVTVIAVIILTAVTYHKGIHRIFSELSILAAVCLLGFPMVFTAVRMIPAVVNDPIRYDIEFQDESFMIYEGDPIDSDKYMTIRRFLTVLSGRFQTQADSSQAGVSPAVRENGLLAYAGRDLAGMDMRMADGDDQDVQEEQDDISNGRFKIFREYLNELRFSGHPKMGPLDEKGMEYAHAHNSYLQVAYHFGIIAGVLFLILCAMTLWRSITLYLRHGRRYHVMLVPFALVVVFGFVSLTEWAFHPCIPAGFCFLMMQVFLIKG